MKKLYTIAFISLTLLVGCSKKENDNRDIDEIFAKAMVTNMPDSALLATDTVSLCALRDSNYALYKRSKKQEDYEQAIKYITQYRIYYDSIQKVQHAHVLAEMYAKYNHEKLEIEQLALKIKKENAIILWVIIVSSCFCLYVIIMIFFQHRMIRKTRMVRNAQIRLYDLTEQIALNQLSIRTNENLIQTIEEQLTQQAELEEYVRDQQTDLEHLCETNTQLLRENSRLENEVKKLSYLLQESGTEQPEFNRLLEMNNRLLEKEGYMLGTLIRKLKMISSLKENPHHIYPKGIKQVINETEMVYPGFVAYLHDTFSKLSDLDLLTCCLIKLKFTIPQIAIILGVDAASVSKRKYRIKEAMCEILPDIWDKGESIDLYIHKLIPGRCTQPWQNI